MPWFFLTIAIVAELIGTLGLRAASDRPTWWLVALVLAAYLVSFTGMAFALRHLKVGVVYAIWSAVGIAAISVAGWLIFGDRLRWPALLGIALITTGVAVLVAFGGAARA